MKKYILFKETDTLNIGDYVYLSNGGYKQVIDIKNNYYHLEGSSLVNVDMLISRSNFLEECCSEFKNVSSKELIYLSGIFNILFFNLFTSNEIKSKFKLLIPDLINLKFKIILKYKNHYILETYFNSKNYYVSMNYDHLNYLNIGNLQEIKFKILNTPNCSDILSDAILNAELNY